MNSNDSSPELPDEEHTREQIDEVLALSLIYPEEFRLVSRKTSATTEEQQQEALSSSDDGAWYEHPIIYTIRLTSNSGPSELSSSSSFAGGTNTPDNEEVYLRVEYPPSYPDVLPLLSLERRRYSNSTSAVLMETMNDFSATACLNAVKEAIREEAGVPCVMTCIQVAQDYWDSQADGDGAGETSSGAGDDVIVEALPPNPDNNIFYQLPGPILSRLILGYCNVVDQCRACMSCQLLRQAIERKAKRTLRSYPVANYLDGHHHSEQEVNVDGEVVPGWVREEKRCAEELRTYHQKLYYAENTTEFDIVVLQSNGRQGVCRAREGWGRCDDPPVGIGDNNEEQLGQQWTIPRLMYWGRNVVDAFYYARAEKPISMSSMHWYIGRVRAHCARNDGDVWVGIVTKDFDESPSTHFDVIPGGGFGVENRKCAFVNVVSGGSLDGRPMEINFGLIFNGSPNGVNLSYGIPVSSYTYNGRPVLNHGKVKSFLPVTDMSAIYIAIIAANADVETQFHISVSLRDCSEREWSTKMAVPYNDL